MKRYGLSLIETVVSTILIAIFLSYIGLLSSRIRQSTLKQITQWEQTISLHNDASFRFYSIEDYLDSTSIRTSIKKSEISSDLHNLTYSGQNISISIPIFKVDSSS